ncbi:MAG: SapC family protein [Gammaproteobacteria bacterium]|nr:SapC family protein [Gammaproteobacteria bacterium]
MSDDARLEGGYTTKPLPEGSMFLYQKPELLTKEDHGSLGITPSDRPFDFANKTNTVPVLASEIASAQKSYPVIFSDPENPQILAIVSVIQDKNMFVDDNGRWAPSHYVPAYLRRYPYALARGENDSFALVIDRASSAVTEDPQFPFFSGDGLADETSKMVEFCQQMEAERHRTIDFIAKLKELDLLSVQEVKAGGVEDDSKEQPALASYYAVDTAKLNDLSAETVKELHTTGYLAFIFAHLFSMENWRKLLERHQFLRASGQQG